MISLIKRNILLYYRDKASVFFSLLAVFIIIGLNVLFLGELSASSLLEQGVPNGRLIVDLFTFSGVLAVVGFSTALGATSQLVQDRVNKTNYDFMSAPIKRTHLLYSYLISAFIISFIMTTLVIGLLTLYSFFNKELNLSIHQIGQLMLVNIISSIGNAAIVLFPVLYIKSNSAFAGLSTIIGTLIGFLSGSYIPMGNLPPFFQSIVKIFPISQAAVLYRKILVTPILDESLKTLPIQLNDYLKTFFGIDIYINSINLTKLMLIGIMTLYALIFLCIDIIKMKHTKLS